uniref:DNA-directed RNA polymerase subunit n=1 Tax=Prototheca wickerhamii TaxID=3111 RepID=A0A067Z1A2_PROWI|nr:beta' chain of RNA polymerase [Prototheca wickerhamii]
MTKNKMREIQKVKIGLTSPREIQDWGERYLLDGTIIGEINSWETVNYKTLKPEMGGLFCQKIFGPIKDYTCACGKKNKKTQTKICENCGVERTLSRVRRYRFGHIKLSQPVVHSLYASSKPSPLGACINWSNKRLQGVISATEFCHLPTHFLAFNPWFNIVSIFKNKANEPKNNKNSYKLTKTINKKQVPKLFRKLIYISANQNINKFKLKTNLETIKKVYKLQLFPNELFLYGINYDMTWDQVENFQEFLFYNWAQPSPHESLIPYYFFTKKIKNENLIHQTRQTTNINDSQKINQFQSYPIQTGGSVIEKILAHYHPINFQKQLELEYKKINTILDLIKQQMDYYLNIQYEKQHGDLRKKWNRLKQVRKKYLRRLGYFRKIFLYNMQPAWMVLSCLPVLPPDLRPVTKLGGQIFISDLNSLYRKVLTRSKRISHKMQFTMFDPALSGSWNLWCFNLRLLQEAVDSLLQTGNMDSYQNDFSSLAKQGKKTKALIDSLKGKKGRFRQHLLGKRVDYSGRSVIVVGPTLKIYECGLPLEMAIELFQPYIIQKLRSNNITITTTSAKAFIAEHQTKIWDILTKIMRGHPILLNRAPTLHRLGIQAFFPKLVLGKAILLHPLVCPAFNADFDGDQMAVHIPLSLLARTEALNLIWARNNLLAPASGQPLLLPAQDMVLGCYYLTSAAPLIISNLHYNKLSKKLDLFNNFEAFQNQLVQIAKHRFFNFQDVRQSFEKGALGIHTPIWIYWPRRYQNMVIKKQAQASELLLECQIDFFGNTILVRKDRYKFRATSTYSYIRTTPGRLFFYELTLNL